DGAYTGEFLGEFQFLGATQAVSNLLRVMELDGAKAMREGHDCPDWLRGQQGHALAYHLRIYHLPANASEHRSRRQSLRLCRPHKYSLLPGRGSGGKCQLR